MKLEIIFETPLIVQHMPVSSEAGVWITTRYEGFTTKGKTTMAYTLPSDKFVNLEISYVDSKGNPAEVDGDVEWETSDEMICNVGVLEGDSTKAQLVPGSKLGNAQITATADADLGEGTSEIKTILLVSVVAGSAVAGTITPSGEPQPIEDADNRPDNTLPGKPARPDNSLPGSGARPDNSLPGSQPGIDNSLPGSGARPGHDLPQTPQPKK